MEYHRSNFFGVFAKIYVLLLLSTMYSYYPVSSLLSKDTKKQLHSIVGVVIIVQSTIKHVGSFIGVLFEYHLLILFQNQMAWHCQPTKSINNE